MKNKKFLNIINDQRLIIIIIVLAAVVGFINPIFISKDNLLNVLYQISINGIIAIGMTYLLIGGDFDLSVGSNMAIAATMMVILEDFGPIVSILGALLISTLAGFINGIIVARFKVNSFITTLGMMVFLRGCVLILTDSRTLIGKSDIYFRFGYGTLFGLPYQSIILILFYLIFGTILAKTLWGKRIYSVGSSEEVSLLFGIDVIKTKIFSFILTGTLCGIAGLFLFTRINSASGIYGMHTNLEVLTAVFLGGTSLFGGKGSIYRTFKGVILVGLISNALYILNLNPYIHVTIKGMILIIAVVIDSYTTKSKNISD